MSSIVPVGWSSPPTHLPRATGASIILYAVDVDIIHVGEKIRGLTEMRRLELSD